MVTCEVPEGTYQNGGYWATPSGWLAKTLFLVEPEVARALVADLVNEFAEFGVHEWISESERVLPGYVASVADILGAAQPSKRVE